MLATLNLGDGQNVGTADGRIALDCSVRPTRYHQARQQYTISTTDFFFPLVDSPYVQGRIGAANVLSDLYAQGVEHCDFVLMLLAACRAMPAADRTICTQEMVKGFRDACRQAGTVVTGGQTVLNPWPIIGGVATSVVAEGEFVFSDGAQATQVVVLTKPLGTQIAANVHQWKKDFVDDEKTTNNKKKKKNQWQAILDQNVLTSDQGQELMHKAVCSMARLNHIGARLMLKHGATAATDVTGFGLLGHAQNLVDNQKAAVGIELHTLPCFHGSVAVNEQIMDFGLTKGTSAETSGGLMVVLPTQEAAQAYCTELQQLDDNCPAWIVGNVVDDHDRKAVFREPINILHI